MTDYGNEAVTRARKQAAAQGRAQGLETGYTVFSYLLAGMAAYGGIGWLIGRAVHVALLFPLGMLLGLGIAIGYIIYRFGRQGTQQQGTTAARDTAARPGTATEGDYR
jgi:F0F1-type ATP synthase assembly protein I